MALNDTVSGGTLGDMHWETSVTTRLRATLDVCRGKPANKGMTTLNLQSLRTQPRHGMFIAAKRNWRRLHLYKSLAPSAGCALRFVDHSHVV